MLVSCNRTQKQTKQQARAKKRINLKIVSWHSKVSEQNFYHEYFAKLLSQKYDAVYSDSLDLLMHSIFCDEHLNYVCVRVGIIFENLMADFNVSDYAFVTQFMDFGYRYMRFPYFAMSCIYRARQSWALEM